MTPSFYRMPREHHKNLKSTNMLDRIMEELKRRTLVVRIFPSTAGCLRAGTRARRRFLQC
jgi:putative transposase